MRIPALDMKAQLAPIREEIDQAIARVLDHGGFILGKEVEEFEQAVCAYTKAKYAVGVSNGTDAIALALQAIGVKQGDKVLCPAFTYYATAGAIVRMGAVPVFIDIDPKTYCIDPDSIRDYLRRNTQYSIRNTIKAIIPVHLYGQCAEMDSMLDITDKFNLKIVEDTAQAFGATYRDRQAGTIGDCGTVSLFPGKNLGACGDAGIVLTGQEKIAERLNCLRNQGSSPEDRYRHVLLGHNNRLDAIQAAILVVKLKYIDSWNQKRAENAAYYNEELADLELITPYVADVNTHIYHQYMVRANNNASRNSIMSHLNQKGIDSRVFYPMPLHLQNCFEYLGYKKGDFPVSEKAAKELFSLPVYPELTREQMDYVVESVKEGLLAKSKNHR